MRLVHLADLHLGYRAYNRVTSLGINRREADVFSAFNQALDKIINLKPDLVLMAGDIFHVPRPTNLAICQTQRELVKFRAKCDAEIVVIAGNHESIKTADNRCILDLFSLIPKITVVTSKPEAVEVCDGKIKVFCLPHNSLERLDQVQIAPDPNFAYNLLMLHGTVDSNRINDYGGYDVSEKVLQMPWNYVACGHYHSFTELGHNAYYAGAIERTSNDIWKEADEDKGFIEFDLINHKAKFHPVQTRATIDFPAIDATDLAAQEIDRLLANHAQEVDITDKLVRQRIINLPRTIQAQLDYRQVRSFQAQAVHYLLDIRSNSLKANAIETPKSGSISDRAQIFLQNWTLPSAVDRHEFVVKGLSYLQSDR